MKVLVTGGAGFIGSNIVHALAARGDEVIVYDDFSNGRIENLRSSDVRVVWGDLRDGDKLARLLKGVEVVSHQAALGSVPQSLALPAASMEVNMGGTLTLLQRAKVAGVRRVVAASSSSVYGPRAPLPTPETAPYNPVSPYAVSKVAMELLMRVWALPPLDLDTIVLRYFNVFGPRQRPDVGYAAVIPLFLDAMSQGRRPVIFGDGRQARDFTYIDNVVAANLAALDAPQGAARGAVLNVCAGRPHTLLDLVQALNEALGTQIEPEFAAARPGDIGASHGDAARAAGVLGWSAEVAFAEGIRRTVQWFTEEAQR